MYVGHVPNVISTNPLQDIRLIAPHPIQPGILDKHCMLRATRDWGHMYVQLDVRRPAPPKFTNLTEMPSTDITSEPVKKCSKRDKGDWFCARIWVRSRNCGCLVTWFSYHLKAKPGNKTATVPCPDPYTVAKTSMPHSGILSQG